MSGGQQVKVVFCEPRCHYTAIKVKNEWLSRGIKISASSNSDLDKSSKFKGHTA